MAAGNSQEEETELKKGPLASEIHQLMSQLMAITNPVRSGKGTN